MDDKNLQHIIEKQDSLSKFQVQPFHKSKIKVRGQCLQKIFTKDVTHIFSEYFLLHCLQN